MTSTIDGTTTTHPSTAPRPDTGRSAARRALDGRWPLAAIGAGLSSFVFLNLSSHFLEEDVTSGGVDAVVAAVDGDGAQTHLGLVAAFLTVGLLAVFAVGFGRFLVARAPEGSAAAQVARLGLTATVATVSLAAGLKAIYRGGLPDHLDSVMYTPESVATLQILVDQYQWASYWTLVLAMGAVAVLGLKDKVLPRSYAALSAVLTVFVLGMTLVLGLPYSSGLIAPIWLVATGIALLRLRTRLA